MEDRTISPEQLKESLERASESDRRFRQEMRIFEREPTTSLICSSDLQYLSPFETAHLGIRNIIKPDQQKPSIGYNG